MKLTKLQAVGVKQETTQGTPVVPVAGTDYLVTENVDININPELLKRDYRRATLDNLPHLIGKRWVTVKFKTELKGSGTAGTAYVPLGAALQACAMTETIVAVTSVTYAPTSAAASASYFGPGKSVTLEVYKHGLKHIVSGAVGTYKITAVAGHYPEIEFEFHGVYTAVTDASMPTPTYIAQLPAIWQNSTISVLGSALIINKWEIDMANHITPRDDAASATSIKGFVITDRDPKGSVDPEGESVATHDFFGKLIGSNSAASSLVIGATAGNIITITMPATQYNDVNYADRDGLQVFNTPIAINGSTGDDCLTIAMT
jgi:hypothetical protein